MDAAKWKPVLKVADIQLSSEPVVDGFEGKSALCGVSPLFPIADNEFLSNKEIIPIYNRFAPTDTSNYALYIMHCTLRKMAHPSYQSCFYWSYQCYWWWRSWIEYDKFSRAAIDKQFEHWFAAIYNHVPRDVARRVLTRLHVDSWGGSGIQSGATRLPPSSRRCRGYDLIPWLPLFAGVPIESSARSDGVLRDAPHHLELVNDVFFDEVGSLAHKYGCQLSAESVAPTMVSDGMSHYRHADLPMGEFFGFNWSHARQAQ